MNQLLRGLRTLVLWGRSQEADSGRVGGAWVGHCRQVEGLDTACPERSYAAIAESPVRVRQEEPPVELCCLATVVGDVPLVFRCLVSSFGGVEGAPGILQ